jgi:hypothetical protein
MAHFPQQPDWYNTHLPRNGAGNIVARNIKEGLGLSDDDYTAVMQALSTAFTGSDLDPLVNPEATLSTQTSRALATDIINSVRSDLIAQYNWDDVPITWIEQALYAMVKHAIYNRKRRVPTTPSKKTPDYPPASPSSSHKAFQRGMSMGSNTPTPWPSSPSVNPSQASFSQLGFTSAHVSDLHKMYVKVTSETSPVSLEDILTSYLTPEGSQKPEKERTEFDFDFGKLQADLVNHLVLSYNPREHKLVFINSQNESYAITSAGQWRIALQDMWARQQKPTLHLKIEPLGGGNLILDATVLSTPHHHEHQSTEVSKDLYNVIKTLY